MLRSGSAAGGGSEAILEERAFSMSNAICLQHKIIFEQDTLLFTLNVLCGLLSLLTQ